MRRGELAAARQRRDDAELRGNMMKASGFCMICCVWFCTRWSFMGQSDGFLGLGRDVYSFSSGLLPNVKLNGGTHTPLLQQWYLLTSVVVRD